MREYEHDARVMSAILDDKATRLGGKVFVRDGERELTYGELSTGSSRVANFLASRLGVGKEDKVAVILPNCVDYFCVQFGIAKAGAVMVPINTMAKNELLAHFLNNSDAAVAVIDEQFLPLLEPIADAVPKLRTLIVRGGEAAPAAGAAGRFERVAFGALSEAPAAAPANETAWYDPVDIFYTSGTTGVSKGVVLSHNHHYTFGLTIAESARLGPEDVMYVCLPLYHGMGSYMSIMPMLLCEGSIALGGAFSASRWLDEIRRCGATVTWSVYSIPPLLMKQPERPDDSDNPLRVFLYSGMAPDIVERFEKRYGTKVLDCYGSTESAHLAYSVWGERRPGAVGPINSAYYDVEVVDEHDNVLPRGEVGECVSRCRYPYTQMTEYYRMPEETLKTFRNRWLHSGDLCRIDADGWLYFLGRGKDTIRRRGENISCFELETILSAYERIQECASVPVPSQLGEDEIKVIVARRPGIEVDFEGVLRYCRDNMPKFMIPRFIEIVDEVAKLPNHKIDKARLKKEGLTLSTWDAETGDFVRPGGE